MKKQLNIAPANINDYRQLAAKRLPRQLFDYIDGGAYQEITLQENIDAFAHIKLQQRVLRNVEQIDTGINLFEQSLSMPIMLSPVGLTGCFARRGEVQALNAAAHHNIPFCLSTVSICSIEELAKQTDKTFWFQLYIMRDRNYAKSLLQKAAQAGCKTLVLTVDLAVVGERQRDVRNGINANHFFAKVKKGIDIATHPKWLWDVAIKGQPLVFGNLAQAVPSAKNLNDFKSWVDAQFDPRVTWQDLAWIREHWQGSIVIKGIMNADDAKQAINFGADAIVVSNHGGRQLDSVPATLTVLPEIKQVVKNQCKLFIDGGIRSGLDVVKALALGADACLLGRAWVYALAAEGEQGVINMLTTMQQEMKVAMALTGVTSVEQINSDILYSAT